VDAEFLAGFIALRRLNDAGRALGHFKRLAGLSKAAIKQGRAQYWIGRAEAAAGHKEAALAAYGAAALWPNTFYGQLAALQLGDGALAARISAAGDPPADPIRAMEVAGRELARAAAFLAQWGEARRASTFLLRLDEVAPEPADRVLVAKLATELGMAETAVALARRAGRDGVILMDSGWPQAATPPVGPVPEPALVLGVIRQESSFDGTTISPVGARGLMQIMPATGAQTAKKLGLPVSVPALVLDPAYNMKIGSAYLRELLDQFAGAVPLVVAGYNAGPGRVGEWLRTHGDPRQGGVDMIDWIELIPFAETRNYVQRVIENQVIYRAKRGEARAHPLAAWLK
jgi:soluble lytic murein transglycosylase